MISCWMNWKADLHLEGRLSTSIAVSCSRNAGLMQYLSSGLTLNTSSTDSKQGNLSIKTFLVESSRLQRFFLKLFYFIHNVYLLNAWPWKLFGLCFYWRFVFLIWTNQLSSCNNIIIYLNLSPFNSPSKTTAVKWI